MNLSKFKFVHSWLHMQMSTSSSLQVLAIMILSMDMYADNHMGMDMHAYILRVYNKGLG